MTIMKLSAQLVEREVFPKLATGFSVCELGNQRYCGAPARAWYEKAGCGRYLCIDGNGEDGALVADLNRPLPVEETFDLVTDFGTGEHCFNQAQIWHSLHDLTSTGGLIVIDRAKAGLEDHCFYSIHPVLIYDLAAANGYEILFMGRHVMNRGENIAAIMRKVSANPFAYPLQSKYDAMLGAIA